MADTRRHPDTKRELTGVEIGGVALLTDRPTRRVVDSVLGVSLHRIQNCYTTVRDAEERSCLTWKPSWRNVCGFREGGQKKGTGGLKKPPRCVCVCASTGILSSWSLILCLLTFLGVSPHRGK